MFILFSLFYSCSKKYDFNRSEINNPQGISSTKNWDLTVKAVAIDVSHKLKSVYFRKMIKHETSLRFDGDANILIRSLIKRLPKYLEFEKTQVLNNKTTSGDSLLSLFNFDVLKEASDSFPQMQIAVQPDVDSWDAASFIPKVVYLTSDYDEIKDSTVSGFNEFMNPISVSTLVDPSENYIVISQNERTIQRSGDVLRLRVSECPIDELIATAPYNPEAIVQPLTPCTTTGGSGTAPYIQYVGIGQDGVLPSLISTQIGTSVPTPTGGTFNRLSPVGTFSGVTLYRKNYKHEKMRFIRCDNLAQIEGWPAGAPEIRVHVFEQNVLNPSETLQTFKEEFEPRKRSEISGVWWNAQDVSLHLWDYQGTGSKVSFGYYEYDPVLIPNEAVQQIGSIVVDILVITGYIDSSYSGIIQNSFMSGIRYLKKKNGMSEYIGKDDYSIFNDEDQFNHSPGGTKFKTWPDL